MRNQESNSKIRCEIFQNSYRNLNSIKSKINNTRFPGKAEYAEELSKEVDRLLDCTEYNSQNSDCANCRIIAQLHKKTATLIIKAKTLA